MALAGVVLVGQALARTVYGTAEAGSALRALGFTRNGLVGGLVLPQSVTAAVAMTTAVGTAIALSPWFPVGLAGRLEPDRGLHADWLVVAPGAVTIALAVLAGAAVAALRATSSRPGHLTVGSRTSLAPVLRRVAPLPAVIGAGLALRRGEGSRALPVRPALASGIAAVLGVVGAFGLLSGIDDALLRPERSGQFWDAELIPNGPEPGTASITAALRSEEQVAEIATLNRVNMDFDGASVSVYSLAGLEGDWSFTLLDGRTPVGDRQVVIGPATAKALGGRRIGDTVRAGTEGWELRVVGLGLLPQTPHFSFDQGAWLSGEGFERLAPPAGDESPREQTTLVRFAPGSSLDDSVARLEEHLGGAVSVEPRSLPQDVQYLRNVRSLPKALAGFLLLLGLGAMGHVLATTVRRRRHDLAVLRALGFRPLQVGGCVAWQAVTVSLVALLVGIPLGIAAGRWSWRWVADSTPLLYVPPVAALVVLLSIPASLLLANVMAAVPARRAATLRPADVLRAE